MRYVTLAILAVGCSYHAIGDDAGYVAPDDMTAAVEGDEATMAAVSDLSVDPDDIAQAQPNDIAVLHFDLDSILNDLSSPMPICSGGMCQIFGCGPCRLWCLTNAGCSRLVCQGGICN